MSKRTHIVLGDRVQCRITDFVGIATARTDWIYGCVRWGVQREELVKDKGTIMEPVWFDDDQLFIVDHNAHLTPGLLEASKPKKPPRPSSADRPSRTRTRTGGPDRGEALDDPAETG